MAEKAKFAPNFAAHGDKATTANLSPLEYKNSSTQGEGVFEENAVSLTQFFSNERFLNIEVTKIEILLDSKKFNVYFLY